MKANTLMIKFYYTNNSVYEKWALSEEEYDKALELIDSAKEVFMFDRDKTLITFTWFKDSKNFICDALVFDSNL